MKNKRQQCITSKDFTYFERECSRLIRDGWRVIPGTVSISTTSNAVNTYPFTYFVAFFEKDEE
jgi:hypothetical protein